MVATTQLRAVLAVLHVEAGTLWQSAIPPWNGRSWWLCSKRWPVTPCGGRSSTPPLGQCAESWSAAAAASHTAVPEIGLSEQAQFDANWLRQRIDTLATHTVPAPSPTSLEAAARAVDAAGILLALARNPVGDGSHDAWRSATHKLAYALHLVNDEYNNLTQPVR